MADITPVWDSIPAATFKVKYKDFFHMKHLYLMTYMWLTENGWADRDAELDFPEILYLHRDLPKMNIELSIWWRFKRGANIRYSSTKDIEYSLNIDFKVVLLKDAEIVHKNQKYSTNWGEVEISVASKVLVLQNWKTNSFFKHVQNAFRGRVIKSLIEKHRIELYRESYRLQEALKSFLNLKTYLPEPEDQAGLYFPKLGVGEA